MTNWAMRPVDLAVLGENLRAARERIGLTQVSIAAALSVDVRTYTRWEAGDTRGAVARIEELAELVGVFPEELLRAPSELSEDQVEQLRRELREEFQTGFAELRALIMDPDRLRAAANELEREAGAL